MRSLSYAIPILLCGCALAAHAGPLVAATWRQGFQGIDIVVTDAGAACTDTSADHVQQTIVCPTAGLSATGFSTPASYSVSLTLPPFLLTQVTTGAELGAALTDAALSGRARISGDASGAAATQGIPGRVTVKAAAHVVKGANASVWRALPTTLAKLPLSVGKGGTFTGYFYVRANLHYFQVRSYAWTPHTVSLTGLTSQHLSLPTVVAMGSFALTPDGGGTVTLVAPSRISVDGPFVQRRTASFTVLKLTYMPEPSLLLLLGAGLAGGVAARSRAYR
jgi:hypothetical protein